MEIDLRLAAIVEENTITKDTIWIVEAEAEKTVEIIAERIIEITAKITAEKTVEIIAEKRVEEIIVATDQETAPEIDVVEIL